MVRESEPLIDRGAPESQALGCNPCAGLLTSCDSLDSACIFMQDACDFMQEPRNAEI
jgi:hypothetical protein